MQTSAVITGLQDTLDDRIREFAQQPLRQSLVINSAPKSGTHLVRNILRMFAPPEQHYSRAFLHGPLLRQHAAALTTPHLSCAHLLFDDEAVMALAKARHILLIRDPYDWVLARARFYISNEFQQANLAHLKSGAIPTRELLNMMIFGIHQKLPSLLDVYTWNTLAWLGTAAVPLRYEDVLAAVADLESAEAEAFFRKLLGDSGVDPVPEDWRERVRIGSDRRQSRTARENLNLAPGIEIPAELPAEQKRLVDVAAPGLRAALGYA